jgi:hypothetical protein
LTKGGGGVENKPSARRRDRGAGMKGGTVQIAWHGSEPILSLDFHSISGLLATAGADHDIKVFYPCVPPCLLKMWLEHQGEGAGFVYTKNSQASMPRV